jgi:hypothetical protein
MRRHKLNRRSSRKMFRKGASKVHKKNISSGLARGGIRL